MIYNDLLLTSTLVPPTPPVLHVFQTTTQQIQIQWKLEDDGGSPVRGFLLHWRYADGGDWEERELDRQATSTQLDVIIPICVIAFSFLCCLFALLFIAPVLLLLVYLMYIGIKLKLMQ